MYMAGGEKYTDIFEAKKPSHLWALINIFRINAFRIDGSKNVT